jgi:capsid protein
MKTWWRRIMGGVSSASPTPNLDRVPADLRAGAVRSLRELAAAYAGGGAGGGVGVRAAVDSVGLAGGGGYATAAAAARASGRAGRGSPRTGPARSVLTPVAQGRMRAECRRLARNNAVVRGFIRRLCEHIVGDGFIFKVQTGDEAWDREATAWLREEALRVALWRKMQWVVRSFLTDGDAFFLKVRGGDGLVDLQAVESELLVTPDEKGNPLVWDDGRIVVLPDGGMISAGVETDASGVVVAYHVAEWGDVESLRDLVAKTGRRAEGTGAVWAGTAGVYGLGKVKRIPASMALFLTPETFGNPGQHRGEPGLQAMVPLATLLYQYMGDVLVAADMATKFGLIIAAANPALEKKIDEASLLDEAQSMAAEVAAGRDPEIVLESAMVKYVHNVGAVHQVKPEFPTVNAGQFMDTVARYMGAEVGLPPMLSTYDMNGLTASNAKVTMSVVYRGLETPQMVLVEDLGKPFGRFSLGSAIAAGKVSVPPVRAGVRPWWSSIQLATPYPPVMDLLNEAKAWRELVGQNLATHDEATRQMGFGDGDEVAAARRREIDRDRRMGITPADLPGAARPGSGSAQGGGDEPENGDGGDGGGGGGGGAREA